MLSIATLETGDLRLGPTGRSTPVVGRKRTLSGENQPCNAFPILPDWRLLASPFRRPQVLGITTRRTRNRPAFIPTLDFGRVRGFRG